MKAKTAEAVRSAFEQRLTQELPHFRRSDEQIAPECRLYVWELSVSLRAYVMLQVHRSEEAFTLEVAWTRHRRWPSSFLRTPGSIHERPAGGDMRFRASMFWGEKDHWWSVPSDRPVEVGRAVDEAIRSITTHAVPFFSQLVMEV